MMSNENLVTIDVEDWYHILDIEGAPDVEGWARLEGRVEANLRRILDEFDAAGAHGTFFFLGWIGERFPGLVRETRDRGHEVACHGHVHQLVHSQTRAAFAADIRRAKATLEAAAGVAVNGYRAPGFSITRDTPWAFDEIAAAGFVYDSSVFPGTHGHGGLRAAPPDPHRLQTAHGELFEFPQSVVPVLSRPIAFFGGGYLRLFPYPLIAAMAGRVRAAGRPVVYYLHPREIDPAHPRLPMSRLRRFKSYVNLDTTLPKLRRVLREGPCITMQEWLARHGQPDPRRLACLPAAAYLGA
jgi:polysaccharide deacetylase family protein (PEP-CTERM system associated)